MLPADFILPEASTLEKATKQGYSPAIKIINHLRSQSCPIVYECIEDNDKDSAKNLKVFADKLVTKRKRKFSLVQNNLGTSLINLNKRFRLQANTKSDPECAMQLNYKKGLLVLDLDHTLCNATVHTCASLMEDCGIHQIDNLFIKLRPFAKQLVQKCFAMYDVFVYTMGCRSYAETVMKLLDPEQKVLSMNRLVARDDYPQEQKKNLYNLPVPNIGQLIQNNHPIVIVDDLPSIWKESQQQYVIPADPFMYFNELPFDTLYQQCPLTNENLPRFTCDVSILNIYYDEPSDKCLPIIYEKLVNMILPWQPLAGKNIIIVKDPSSPLPLVQEKQDKNNILSKALHFADMMGAHCYVYNNLDKPLTVEDLTMLEITHIVSVDNFFKYRDACKDRSIWFVNPLWVLETWTSGILCKESKYTPIDFIQVPSVNNIETFSPFSPCRFISQSSKTFSHSDDNFQFNLLSS